MKMRHVPECLVFFFNDTATTEIYTLSLHDALPIYPAGDRARRSRHRPQPRRRPGHAALPAATGARSEEHTSELQSRPHLVCRLLLEKKKQTGGRLLQAAEGARWWRGKPRNLYLRRS